MVGVKTTYSLDSFQRVKLFASKFPFAIEKATEQAATFGKGLIVKATPVKVGDARKSWEVDRDTKNPKAPAFVITSRVGKGSFYTPFLEYGTGVFGPKRRPIYPTTAKYLWFPIIKGNTIKAWVKRKWVAGMPAVGMIKNNIKKIQERLTFNISAIIRKWGGV